jgi:NADPH-dependent F420 reductase
MRIAVLGGTGPEGLGLAARLAQIGEAVIIGSRSAERAEEAAKGLRAKLPQASLQGALNAKATMGSEIVVLAFPYEGIEAILADCAGPMAGRVVIDTIVPLKVDGKFFGVEPPPDRPASGFKRECRPPRS